MKKYQSHKIVEAAPIVAAEFQADGSGKVVYRDEHGGPVIVNVPAGFKRPNSEPQMDHDGGDYLVRYQPDGYLSWSPKAVFEAGYCPLIEPGIIEPRGTPAAVEVTVTAPAGKRAHVSLGSMGHSARSSWTVTEGQRQTWSVAPGEFVTVHEDEPHSTVAHKRDDG